MFAISDGGTLYALNSSMIYFLEADTTPALIKIGYTAKGVQERLSELQIGSPVEIRILGIMEGGCSEEQELHQRFAAYRVRGEWFRSHHDLDFFIRANAKRVQAKEERIPLFLTLDWVTHAALAEICKIKKKSATQYAEQIIQGEVIAEQRRAIAINRKPQ